jgi:hypothetical protein
LERLEYSIITKADRCLTWKVFSDWRKWHKFSDIYKDIRWIKGQPWQAGSRMKIEIQRPLHTTVDHVIISCSPPKHVAWIDHTMGNTMEQWVLFEPHPEGGTRVFTWAEFTGMTDMLGGRPMKGLIGEFIRNWYGKFGETCDALSEQGADAMSCHAEMALE